MFGLDDDPTPMPRGRDAWIRSRWVVCGDDDSDHEWKPNVGVALIDFLMRHGAIDTDAIAFLPLVESLKGAECP
jgi:hypothetical protein